MKKMKGWRTVLFNVAVTAAGSPELLALIPPKHAVWVGLFGNLFLRAITNSPIGRAESK